MLTDLYKFHFEHADKKVVVSRDHHFWLSDNHYVIADKVKFKDKVFGIDKKKIKIIGKEAVINESQVKKMEKTDEGHIVMYELKLHERNHMYFISSEKIVTFSQGLYGV